MRIITAKRDATLSVASFVADFLAIGLFVIATIPKLNEITEMRVSIRKLML